MKKTIVLILLIASYCIVVSSQSIAYISRDSILNSIESYGKNVAALDSLKANYTQELDNLQDNLEARVSDLFVPYGLSGQESIEQVFSILSPTDSISFSLLLQEDQLLQSKGYSYNNMLNFIYHRDIQPILDVMNTTISDYAKKQKIEVVYIMEETAKSFAYINEKKDITNVIIEELKKKKLK